MERDEAADIIHQIFDHGFADGDFSALPAHVAESYVDHSPIPAPAPGPAGFEARIRGMRAAFADLEIDIEDVSVDGDRVWFRWTMRGRHVGPFAGIEPTERSIVLEGMNLEVFAGSQIVEHFSQFDRLGLIGQLEG